MSFIKGEIHKKNHIHTERDALNNWNFIYFRIKSESLKIIYKKKCLSERYGLM